MTGGIMGFPVAGRASPRSGGTGEDRRMVGGSRREVNAGCRRAGAAAGYAGLAVEAGDGVVRGHL